MADNSSPVPPADSCREAAREVLVPLLYPGEHLTIAFSGDSIEFNLLLLFDLLLLILGGAGAGSSLSTIYVGITGTDLVFTKTRVPKVPSGLHRIPLENAYLVAFKESRSSWINDRLVIGIGTSRRIRLWTASYLRPVVREMFSILLKQAQTT